MKTKLPSFADNAGVDLQPFVTLLLISSYVNEVHRQVANILREAIFKYIPAHVWCVRPSGFVYEMCAVMRGPVCLFSAQMEAVKV